VYKPTSQALPSHANYPVSEHNLLDLLHFAVDASHKRTCGLNNPELYKPGNEKEDSKLICAAVRYVKLRRELKKPDQKPSGCTISQDVEMRDAPPLPPQPKREPPDFGNRIEQALLKIDKWADAWLSGAMPQTDLAWDSFEFCLCMPDILEDGEIMG